MVRSGLREIEFQSDSQVQPILRPWFRPDCQVGDESSAASNSFSNQLIAGFSEIREPEDSFDLVFRLPYYYNKSGKTWKSVEDIIKNWVPANLSTRVQYPYLTADLWEVGDCYFDAQIQGID
jgi:hypothetical protein